MVDQAKRGIRLRSDVAIVDRNDGTFLATAGTPGRAVVLSPDQARLAQAFDGRSLEEMAAQELHEHRTIPFATLVDLCRLLAAEGLLENSVELQQRFGRPPFAVTRRLARWLDFDLVVGRMPPRDAAPAQSDEVRARRSARRLGLAAGLVALVAAGVFFGAGLPALTGVFFYRGSPLSAALALYLGAAAALSIRAAAHAVVARLQSPAAAVPWRLGAAAFVVHVDCGRAALLEAPKALRLAGLGLGTSSMFLFAAACRLSVVVTAGPAVGPAGMLDLFALAALAACWIDLCPLGATAAAQLFAAAAPDSQPVLHGLAYLRRRSLRRVFSTEVFPGEWLWVLFGAWLVVWLVGALAAFTRVGLANLADLVHAIVLSPDRFVSVSALVVTVLLVSATLLVCLAVLVVMLSLLASLWPARRTGARTYAMTSRTPDESLAVLKDVPLFARLPQDRLRELAARARWLCFSRRALLVRQGEPGDDFFVIARGVAEVRVEAPSGLAKVVAQLRSGDGFGEHALIESAPRSATVRALTDGVALAISRTDFTIATAGKSGDDILALIRGAHALRRTPVFSDISGEALARFIGHASVVAAEAGDTIVRRGDPGQYFFVNLEGTLDVLGGDDAAAIAQLQKGDPFGEIALLSDAPRSATVRAATPVSLLQWDRTSFFDFFIHHVDAGARLEYLGSGRAQRQ